MTTVMTIVTNNRDVPRTELRGRIEDAALALFRRQGFDGSSVDEIVAAAGVAKGTFFNFFPRKNAVLLRLFADLDAFMSAGLRGLDPHKPKASLNRLFRSVERRLRREGDLARVLFRELITDPELASIDSQSGSSDLTRYEEFLQACSANRSIAREAKPQIAAQLIQHVWSATIHDWFRAGQSFSLSTALARQLDLIFSGVGPAGRRKG
jgi:AcrR family transcriptional regulator